MEAQVSNSGGNWSFVEVYVGISSCLFKGSLNEQPDWGWLWCKPQVWILVTFDVSGVSGARWKELLWFFSLSKLLTSWKYPITI